MKVDGSCHCGKIRFEADVDPAKIVVCHCTDCQTISGSAFRISAYTEPNSFVLKAGAPTIYVKTTAESGRHRRQAFCPDCGTSIYATDDSDAPTVYVVRLATLTQQDQLAPRRQIWSRSQRPSGSRG